MIIFEKAPRKVGRKGRKGRGCSPPGQTPRMLKEEGEVAAWRSVPETEFAKKAREKGWEVTKRGYPDFICYRGEEMMLVEIKPSAKFRLKKSQERFRDEIRKRGVACLRWSPDADWLL